MGRLGVGSWAEAAEAEEEGLLRLQKRVLRASSPASPPRTLVPKNTAARDRCSMWTPTEFAKTAQASPESRDKSRTLIRKLSSFMSPRNRRRSVSDVGVECVGKEEFEDDEELQRPPSFASLLQMGRDDDVDEKLMRRSESTLLEPKTLWVQGKNAQIRARLEQLENEDGCLPKGCRSWCFSMGTPAPDWRQCGAASSRRCPAWEHAYVLLTSRVRAPAANTASGPNWERTGATSSSPCSFFSYI
eukprot:scaffold184_cov316-Pinguiococcus_pyrenoidosus.AAC.3